MNRSDLAAFVENEYTQVLAVLILVSGDVERSEDALQEALASAWQRSDIRDLRAWTIRVALNHLRSRWRRAAAERRALQRAVLQGARESTNGAGFEPPDAELRAAVRSLSLRQREVVALHYLLDLSVDQVAAMTGVTTGTVKTLLYRARVALRSSIGADLEESEHGV